MTSELVYRMRTCAAALLGGDDAKLSVLHRDAADLLAEASNRLDVPEPLGELMEIMAAAPAPSPAPETGVAWTGVQLPRPAIEARSVTTKPCPMCGSIDARTVRRVNRVLMLTCPVCSNQWEYTP